MRRVTLRECLAVLSADHGCMQSLVDSGRAHYCGAPLGACKTCVLIRRLKEQLKKSRIPTSPKLG